MTEASPVAAEQPVPESSQPEPAAGPTAAVAPGATTAVVASAGAGRPGEVKRKRGRPRKYGPDGGLLLRPLKATPISASVPDDAGGGRYTPAAAVGAVMKRGRGRPVGFVSRAPHVAVTAAAPTAAVVVSTAVPQTQLGPLGELVACASGANFTPHIINVVAGEDVNMNVISFSQQGPGAICILSANGVISSVTLRQPDSLGGTVTYEGRFELLSLSGSFTPTDDSVGTRSRSGGMSVSLAAADGRVIGGGVAGLLVAASPVQVVVGSFLPSYQNAKPAMEMTTTVPRQPPPPPATIGFTISSGGDMEDSYNGSSQPRSANGNSMSAFRVENWTAPAADQSTRKTTPPPPAPVDQARKATPPPVPDAKVPVVVVGVCSAQGICLGRYCM